MNPNVVERRFAQILTNPTLYVMLAGVIGAFSGDLPAHLMPYAKDTTAALTFVAGLLMDPARIKVLVGGAPTPLPSKDDAPAPAPIKGTPG